MDIQKKTKIFNYHFKKEKGLTLNDLNRYLPALQKIKDFNCDDQKIKEGVFYGLSINGLKKIVDNSIDLIITEPPDIPIIDLYKSQSSLKAGEYINWNRAWINESFRILKRTGSIYLICDWRYSNIFQSLLDQKYNIQTRISWICKNKKITKSLGWVDKLYDIWFATKSGTGFVKKNNKNLTNFWNDIIDFKSDESEKIPKKLIRRIIKTSSHKLNWILDPFSRTGNVGYSAVKMGRRFVGFEANKDKLLLSMKKIDRK